MRRFPSGSNRFLARTFTAGMLFTAASALAARAPVPPQPVTDPAALVNVFVGTSGTAVGGPIDTFPGASLPFGMIQWSPDTPTSPEGGGYNYTDHAITGFSLTHLSGPGCAVAGDFRILPTSGPVRSPTTAVEPFSHADEQAGPGWYNVTFAHTGIRVQLAVALRSGLGRFTFPIGAAANLLFNVSSNQAGVTAAHFRVDGPRQVSGSATGGAFCGAPDTYTVYFAARFNRPMSAFGTWHNGKLTPGAAQVRGINSGGWVTFKTGNARSVEMEVALSYVSRADALANLRAAPDQWRLAALRRRATRTWNDMLGRIRITGGTHAEQATFYTALYHTLLEPTLYSDVNGEYMGFDEKVHHVAAGHAEYANYSGWDIYRTEIPLITLLAPNRASDMMQSLVDAGRQGGWLPKWPLENGYTGVMGGDSADNILAGGWAFGARDFHVQAALREMVKGATDTHGPLGQGWYVERPGLPQYLRKGYVDDDLTTSSAPVPNGSSETLEYAEDDFSIARLAAEAGDSALAQRFLRRSMNWQNVFDTATGLISARQASGAFVQTAINSNGQRGFQEGNAAQYTWMVPQDLHDLIAAMGGRAAARRRLNTFFSQLNAGQGAPYAWLGNEPSLGSPWVYLSAGAPWRTEQVVRNAIDSLYTDTPAGLPGNDDLGTMSAWYVWSAIGLYPQIPAVRGLDVGSPLFSHITLISPAGPTLEIDAPGASAAMPFVHALSVNGRPTQRPWIKLPLTGTVRLHFTLGGTPDRHWGSGLHDAPPSFRAGVPHFPPAVAASIAPTRTQTMLRPGQHTTAGFTIRVAAGSPPVSIHWYLRNPAGLRVRPHSGRLTIHAGQHRTVRLRMAAASVLPPGYYNVVVHARASNGALLKVTRLIVRTAAPGRLLPLVFVASSADNAVIPVDPATRSVGPAITVGENPSALVTGAQGTRLYVANGGANTVSVINTRSLRVIATISVGAGPDALALSPGGHTLWVANGGANTIQAVNTATLTAGKPVRVGTAPAGLALAPGGATVYVTNQSGNTISLVDTRTATVRATYPAGAGPSGIVISPDGNTLYVADTLANAVRTINAATGRVGKVIATGLSPRQLAVSARGTWLFVADSAVDTLSVIRTGDGRAAAPIKVSGGPIAVAFSSSGKSAYVVNTQTGRLTAIGTRSRRVLDSFPVGPFPVALSVPAAP